MSVSTNSTTTTFHTSARDGFGTNVIYAYEHGRPEHPIEGVQYLLEQLHILPSSSTTSTSTASSSPIVIPPCASNGSFPALPIVEIGCGTGKYTRPLYSLLEKYCTNKPPIPNLICVDPADMAQKINQDFPSIPFIKTTADALDTIPDHSIGTIIIAQAFHWMSNRITMKELYRILHPQGYIALVWNMRYSDAKDTNTNWINDFESLLNEYYEPTTPRQISGEWKLFLENECTDLFQFPMQSHFMIHDQGGYIGTEEQVLNYVLSISDISKRNKEEKNIIRERFRELLYKPTTPIIIRENDGQRPDTGANQQNAEATKIWKIPMRIEMYWFKPKQQ